jgi:hypothetical protein
MKRLIMAANSEERIWELGKLLKGRIRADWTLLDEAYREPFDELMALLSHRESVVASMMHHVARARADRERNEARVASTSVEILQ